MLTAGVTTISGPMRKIHGWFIIFTGYAFSLLAVAILIVYLQNFLNILDTNPYVILIFLCAIALNLMGAYVIHRSKD
jgi:predicted tellurium resistance membrane protein TerC